MFTSILLSGYIQRGCVPLARVMAKLRWPALSLSLSLSMGLLLCASLAAASQTEKQGEQGLTKQNHRVLGEGDVTSGAQGSKEAGDVTGSAHRQLEESVCLKAIPLPLPQMKTTPRWPDRRQLAGSGGQLAGRRRQLKGGRNRGRGGRRKGGHFSKCRIWVNQNGDKGAFRTIQAAVNAAGRGNTKICVMAGVYYETVRIAPGQNNIILEGAGRNTMIIGGTSRSRHPQQKTFYCAALIVEGDYFIGRRFQVQNPYKSTWDPSPAVTLLGQRSQFFTVGFAAWIDTIGMFTSAHYFRNCYVSGLADMIWGFGRGAFESTTVFIRYYYDPNIKYLGYVTAMGTDWPSYGVSAGAVFWNCKVLGDAQAYLGRPYRPNVEVAFINSYLSNAVYPDTWGDFNGYASKGVLKYSQYSCTGPGANSRTMRLGRAAPNQPAPAYLQIKNFLHTK